MPRVLLTRPQDGSEELAETLSHLGYQSVIEPLLTIKPHAGVQPDFQNLQAVMVTSAHAFDFLDPQLCTAKNLYSLPCYCVGTSTAKAARIFGFQSIIDAGGDGLALATKVATSLKSDHGAILHPSAHDVDSQAREEIERLGFKIEAWTVYKAETATELSRTTQTLLRDRNIDAVLVFSTRTARTLKNLLQTHGLEEICKNMVALGISENVRNELNGLPWRILATAHDPTEKAVLQRLQELLPVTEVK